MKDGEFESAIQDFSETIRLSPKHADAFYHRGTWYKAEGQRWFEHAIADFTEAISIDPQHARAFHGRGLTYFKSGRPELAIADLNVAATLSPQNKAIQADHAYVARATNAKAEAGEND